MDPLRKQAAELAPKDNAEAMAIFCGFRPS